MPTPTLQQIESEKNLVRELRRAAWSDLRDAFLSRRICQILPDDSRRAIVAAVEGYDRELEAVAAVDRELISSGRVESLASTQFVDRAETRFAAPVPLSAVLTPDAAPDAASAIRRGTPMLASESLGQWISGPVGQWDAQAPICLISGPADPHISTPLTEPRRFAAGDGF